MPVEHRQGVEVAPGLAGAKFRSGAAEVLEDTMGRVALDGEDEGIEGLGDDPTTRGHFEADDFLASELGG